MEPSIAKVSILSRPGSRLQLRIYQPVDRSASVFQSSAGREAGCNRQQALDYAISQGFNPQPAGKPAATLHAGRHIRAAVVAVSILSRPGSRLQLGTRGATRTYKTPRGKFQSSAGREAGCNSRVSEDRPLRHLFQSSAGREAGCNALVAQLPLRAREVSILSRPGSRLQRGDGGRARRRRRVSILSRPGSQLQPAARQPTPIRQPRFNPQPAGKPAATACDSRTRSLTVFQSSAGREAGCNCKADASGLPHRTRFNPQPAGKPAATRCSCGCARNAGYRKCFNPQPAGKPAATTMEDVLRQGRQLDCFNPQPAGKPAATAVYRPGRLRRPTLIELKFQSSAGREAGCNLPDALASSVSAGEFQSSAGREAGCNVRAGGKARHRT